jgi:hypothetical protein
VTPFELFLKTGAFLAEQAALLLPLDGLTALMLEYFASLSGVDKTRCTTRWSATGWRPLPGGSCRRR